jgi:hypothetical protein
MLSIVIALFLAQQTPIVLTAKSANVSDAGTPVKINLLRWSTEEERNPIVIALDPAAQAAAQTARGGRGGRGGRAAGGLDPNDPALADVEATPARGSGRGGRGGGGRGGRGGDAAIPAADPMTILSAAIEKAPTVGYLWTNETVGYSIKYAYKTSMPDGSERIILATDRRLGSGTSGWKSTAAGTPNDYPFTLIEIRIDPKGLGEGKASLASKVILDKEAKTVALENYTATPAIFQNVKR